MNHEKNVFRYRGNRTPVHTLYRLRKLKLNRAILAF